ncbi:MAG: hypothetical protein A3F31_01660 [Candidatus Levybacteria bacterium RIFCSPHIGHO2_12_FULL_38_12]|nr:MAG: hypothetical protein A2770_02600 [Candidatus Levybacteria bacterium RIFCSPHIGHO2_01_FULL_38_12]OGH22071.1 MAG: hypothetical protein A3D75_01565 [Candidatus Levybacteria bacterium RIFCSPHIGHO2_02_FULL_37_18]OGH22913.1 MAG: hypothetical protein A3F31_01660 [Candidatus Levybacteria bacterium RIFCSPHIGHO2_12_FULL_38_12]OGH34043.1 MAG: hypothetical protein A3A47_00170 [Candidatus Levybacteria bacterium RIFCSPLOWO2_01_FULL_37_20]OGH44903.1 MAG: hypothetical protein A3J14_02680 [Candidatus Lev
MRKIFNFQFSIFNFEKGQALLVVVLIMIVSLTVGLSIASRSITNIRTSSEEASSQRAFSAAEAGIEVALQTGVASLLEGQDVANNATIKQVTITTVSGSKFLLNGGGAIPRDDGYDVWLSDYPNYANPWNNGDVTFYWGSQICGSGNESLVAALEFILITGNKQTPVASRYAVDPCTLRRNNNNFSTPGPSGSINGINFSYSYKIPVAIQNGLLIRVVPLYAHAVVGAVGVDSTSGLDKNLPPQGTQIVSTGQSAGTQRKIQVFQGYPRVPSEFFQYILFSSGS